MSSSVAQAVVQASEDQKRYPIEMRHPQQQAAVSSGYRKVAGKVERDPPGVAAKYQPVWVQNKDQEIYHASLGYVPVNEPDPATYRTRICGLDAAALDTEYPRALYRLDKEGVMDTALVNNKAEHDTHMAQGWKNTVPEAQAAGKSKLVALPSSKAAEAKAEAQPKPKKKRKVKASTRKKLAEAMRKRNAEAAAAKAAAEKKA